MNLTTPLASRRFNRKLLPIAVACSSLLAGEVRAAALEEVIVTAQKREESLLEVPISITAVSEQELDKYEIDDLFDLANFVPGMVFARAPDDGLVLSLRGVASVSRNQAYEQAVGVFLDGVFFGKGRLYSAAIYDLSRIEVIMGGQTTLLGKNTSVGAISIITEPPGDEFGGYLDVTASEHGGAQVKGAVDVPISDTLNTRIAGYYSDLEGATRNIYTGNRVPIDDNHSVRLATRWDPSDVVNVNFMYQYAQDNKQGDTFQIALDPNGVARAYGINDSLKLDDIVSKGTRFGPGDGDTSHDTDSNIANLVINWEVSGHTLTSQTTYADYDLKFFDDVDLEPGDYLEFNRKENYDQYSQELRIASSDTAQLEYMAGLYYFNSNWDSDELNYWAYPGNPPAGASPPLVPGDLFNGPWINSITQDVDYWAVFASATWHFTDQFRMTAGLRYFDEEKKANMSRTAVVPDVPATGSIFTPYTLWNTVANPPFPPTPLKYSKDKVDGNFIVQYDLNDEVMVYGSASQGTKTGGFAESNTIPTGNPAVEALLGAETVYSYEVGFKSKLLDGSAVVNGAIFYMDMKDLQQTLFTGTEFLTGNADAESTGAELSGDWAITDVWSVSGGVVYADAKEKENSLKLNIAPEWTGNLGISMDQPITDNLVLGFSGNLRYRDGQFSQPKEGIPETDSLTTVDLVVSLSDSADVWSLSVIGRNVFDEVAQDFGYDNTNPAFAGQGVVNGSTNALRTYLLQVSYNF